MRPAEQSAINVLLELLSTATLSVDVITAFIKMELNVLSAPPNVRHAQQEMFV